MKILCIGQAIVDLYIHKVGPELFTPHNENRLDGIDVYGGGDANNASNDLAIMGEEVALATSMGSDAFGQEVRAILKRNGVETKFITVRDDMPTSVHVIVLTGDDDLRGNANLRGTAQHIRREDIPDEGIEWADHVHMVSVLSMPGFDGKGTADVFAKAKAMGKTTSMDSQLGFRSDNNKDYADIPALLADTWKNCDIYLPSYEEVVRITGGITDPMEMKEFFRPYGFKIWGCKMGAKGVFLTNFEEDVFLPTLYEGEPVDTLGCGDAFCSGFIAAYIRGYSLRGCGIIGSAASALICGCIGCSAGMRPFDELVAYAKEHGYDPA